MCNPSPPAHQDTERQPESGGAGSQHHAWMKRVRSGNDKPAARAAPVMSQGSRTGVGRRWLSLGFVVKALSALTMSLPSNAAALAERVGR